MKILPYILYIYLLGFHVTIFSDISSIYGITIDLTALLVCLVAIYKEESTALWFAIAAGFVAGAVNLSLMPWELFVLGGLALALSHLSRRINLDSIASRLMLLAGGLFVHAMVISLVFSSRDFITILFRYIFPSIIYTWLIGWMFFLYRDGRVTWKKIRDLF